ncbi:DUF6476 family protein [Roseivivax isoporae]|uniref:Uncharacterized protein n=1 Tax=Roseivivax isoporae LMG 25204 TaxID=1449351 RepID=X7FBI8_9RHOB|nr:DUF6476 family protein [Roseivivax isoporae]ETX30063.1 hypothetical protein RISW2_17855 [Roseivivax isoporae LMG 25204]
MDDTPDPAPPPELRYLKTLVTVLTAVMIVGVITVATLLVIRLRAPAPPLPEEITLPDGARALAVTLGDDWVAVVTDGDEIVIFDRLTGALRQRVRIDQAP